MTDLKLTTLKLTTLKNMNPIEKKIALVTGAARRVGLCIAEKLHAGGYDLILHYNHSDTEAQALKSRLCGLRADSVTLIRCDLRDTAKLKQRVRETINQLGRLDALINNASKFVPTPLNSTTEDHFQAIFEVNIKAPYFLAQTVAPYLVQQRGAIINIADIYADRPLADYSLYCATKAGVVSLTKSLAIELGPDIRVNAIAPGAIVWPENELNEIAQRRIVSQTPLKRVGSPEDIAKTVLFLLAEADFINGQVLSVDGGRSVFIG